MPDPGFLDGWPQGARCLPTRPGAGGPGGFPPGLRRELKRPSCLTRRADPPYPKGGPPLPERRTPLTRKASLPYSQGGYYLLARRVLLTRKADTPYSRGRAREADTLYSEGGYSLLGRRILLTRKLLARRILLTREADTSTGPGRRTGRTPGLFYFLASGVWWPSLWEGAVAVALCTCWSTRADGSIVHQRELGRAPPWMAMSRRLLSFSKPWYLVTHRGQFHPSGWEAFGVGYMWRRLQCAIMLLAAIRFRSVVVIAVGRVFYMWLALKGISSPRPLHLASTHQKKERKKEREKKRKDRR